MEWIVDLKTVEDNKRYIVFAIANKHFGVGSGKVSNETYVYMPQILFGWQCKRLLQGCYAALEMPEWTGLTGKK
jgi:hypothetical protein